MLPLEFVDRFKAETLARLVRHQVEGRAPVAGDDNGFTPFHLARELGQAVLCVTDRYDLHACDVATNSHNVNDPCLGWSASSLSPKPSALRPIVRRPPPALLKHRGQRREQKPHCGR